MSTVVAPAPLNLARWRTPIMLIAIGCVIALIAFGPRSTLGQFLSPLSFDRGWGREAFSLAIAIQNLLWGAAQPFAGAVADRFGPMRVLCFGAILYATGVCTENLILVDYVTESPNVNGDDRAALLLPDPARLAVQVEEPT
jgi:MFS family permease